MFAAFTSVIALAAVAALLPPFGARAAVGAPDDALAATRIDAAFSSISPVAPDRAIVDAAARVAKSDLGACAGATWPNIDASCLVTADGGTPHAVRTVTIGYQSDASTTVLVRLPTSEIASR